MSDESSWNLADGDEIVPGLTAIAPIGGGVRFEVYLAYDDLLASVVAAKLLRPGHAADPVSLDVLAREHTILTGLAHPVIVRCFHAVLDGPRPHLILEHLEGPTLRSLLHADGALPPAQVLPLGVQLASALRFMSRAGILHLDINPRNVVMCAPPRLIDMSVARTFSEAAILNGEVGTDVYMSPEQCRPGERGTVGPPADVWGLGVALYEALAGRRPFREPAHDGERPQLDDDPAPLPGTTPDPLAGIVMLCLDKDPERRPTIERVARVLEPLAAARPRRMVLGRSRPKWR